MCWQHKRTRHSSINKYARQSLRVRRERYEIRSRCNAHHADRRSVRTIGHTLNHCATTRREARAMDSSCFRAHYRRRAHLRENWTSSPPPIPTLHRWFQAGRRRSLQSRRPWPAHSYSICLRTSCSSPYPVPWHCPTRTQCGSRHEPRTPIPPRREDGNFRQFSCSTTSRTSRRVVAQ